MSDEPNSFPTASSTPAGLYEHYCEHPGCEKWGGFGFGTIKTEPPRWFCFEHRAEGEAFR
jgi:hypothetical protein